MLNRWPAVAAPVFTVPSIAVQKQLMSEDYQGADPTRIVEAITVGVSFPGGGRQHPAWTQCAAPDRRRSQGRLRSWIQGLGFVRSLGAKRTMRPDCLPPRGWGRCGKR